MNHSDKSLLLSRLLSKLNSAVDRAYWSFVDCLRENTSLLITLSAIAVAAYGFELFNFNITIDDEMAILRQTPDPILLAIDRWVVYLLTAILAPYPVLPVVVLALSLAFHVGAVIPLCAAWEIEGRLRRIGVGAIIVSFPAWAYLYSYYPMTLAIGPGLFLSAISLLVFARSDGWRRLLAALPAAGALGVHLAFLPVLATVLLVFLARRALQHARWSSLTFYAITTLVTAFLLSTLLSRLFLWIFSVNRLGYTESYFSDPSALLADFPSRVETMISLIARVYGGDSQIYGVSLHFLPLLLALGLIGLVVKVIRSRLSPAFPVALLFVALALVVNNIAFSLLDRGGYRFLIGVSVAIAGVFGLSACQSSQAYRAALIITAALVTFQFAQATNRWFASAHLSLQADRLLASRLMAEIERLQVGRVALSNVKYIEVIGGYRMADSNAIFRKADAANDTFFFRGPRNLRIAALLNTLGFQKLEPLTPDRRLAVAQHALDMPVWPAPNSVQILTDTVVVKFAPYEPAQMRFLCGLARERADSLVSLLCDR